MLTDVNSGSFQDIFNATAAEIGSTVRSGELSVQDAEASRDEAKALEDERELEFLLMKKQLHLFNFSKHFPQMPELFKQPENFSIH